MSGFALSDILRCHSNRCTRFTNHYITNFMFSATTKWAFVYDSMRHGEIGLPVVGVCNAVTVVASSVSVVESLSVDDAGSFEVVVVEKSSAVVPEVVTVCVFCVGATTQARQ